MGDINNNQLKQHTCENTERKKILYSNDNCEVILICLKAAESTDDEISIFKEQYFGFEQGMGILVINKIEKHQVKAGDGIIVPAGSQYRVYNTSNTDDLKFFIKLKKSIFIT